MQPKELELFDDNEQAFEFHGNEHTQDDDYFDQIVGALQEVAISPQFQEMNTVFLKKHCLIFQDTEENKVEYMPIYKAYHEGVEKYVQQSIKNRVKDYNAEKFHKLLETRTDQIDDQLLDMLLSFDDFEQFKRMMLDAKAQNQILEKENDKSKTAKTANTKANEKAQKHENALPFEPELILSIKPLRKKK